MTAVFDGQGPVPAALEQPVYRLLGIDEDAEQSWQRYATSLIVFSGVALLVVYGFWRSRATCRSTRSTSPTSPPPSPSTPPVASSRTRTGRTTWARRRCRTSPRWSASSVHQFATAARRHRHGRGGHPRLREPRQADHRELLGRPRPRPHLHPAADRVRPRRHLRRPGRRRHARRPGRHPRRPERCDPDHPAGPERLHDGDQAARQQRWRLHERQQRPPLREPDGLHALPLARRSSCRSRSPAPTCSARW